VSSAIVNYAQTNLNDFNRVFRYSKVVQAIDASQISIISNETDIRVIKVINPITGTNDTFDVKFDIPFELQYSGASSGFAIESSSFVYKSQKAVLTDDGEGAITVVQSGTNQVIDTVGTIDYDTGLLQFTNFNVDSYSRAGIKIYAYPRDKDISTFNNVILNIIEEDIDLTVVPVRA
jgi:hypothetical protein